VSVAIYVAIFSREEGFLFCRVVVGDERLRGCIGEGEAAVVEALGKQHYVCDCVVDCEYDHCGQDALENGAEDVEDITG